ncbi:MAG TPA: hypothetical protein VMU60_00360 [Syntrophobacteria bacterium]|nr:hypothetical protein [Syntrophobacteria bacterium]
MIARSTMDMWVFRLRAESLYGEHLDAGRRQDADLPARDTRDVITLREEDGVWLSQGETWKNFSPAKTRPLPFSANMYDGSGRSRVPGDPKGVAVDLFA